MPLTLDQIVQLYRTTGAACYGMEAISQERHALQCGQLAQDSGAGPALVAAALLHDLGHLLTPAEVPEGDDLHEYRAIPFLRGEFPDAVIEPIRLHVAAKRYLCRMEPGYREVLSPASRRSLEGQGGPFTADEADRFLTQPHALDAVDLRRWDDQAKSPTRVTPGWPHFLPLLEQVRLAAASRSVPVQGRAAAATSIAS